MKKLSILLPVCLLRLITVDITVAGAWGGWGGQDPADENIDDPEAKSARR